MTKKWLSLLAIPAVAGGLMLAATTAQGPHRGARIAQYLGLTDAQMAQAKASFQAVRQSGQPVRQQLKQVRQEMFQAVRANDAAGIQQLSAQEGALKGQLLALRENAFAKMYSTLTPEQKAKADQLPEHIRQMKQHRMQNRQTPSNG
jgi:Spy/CpxP family protein refolding chaperone